MIYVKKLLNYFLCVFIVVFILMIGISFSQQRSFISGEYIVNRGMFNEGILRIKEISNNAAWVTFEGRDETGPGFIQYLKIEGVFNIIGHTLTDQNDSVAAYHVKGMIQKSTTKSDITIEIKKNKDNTVEAIVKTNTKNTLVNNTFRKVN